LRLRSNCGLRDLDEIGHREDTAGTEADRRARIG
jgi:hypothetical protein